MCFTLAFGLYLQKIVFYLYTFFSQGILSGKQSGNDEKCLEDQLADTKAAVGKTETELKQLKARISHSEKELKQKKSMMLAKQEEAFAVEKELNSRKKEVEDVKKALESISYEEGVMETLQKVYGAFFINGFLPENGLVIASFNLNIGP